MLKDDLRNGKRSVKKMKRSNIWFFLFEVAVLALMGVGMAWIMIEGFGDNYDRELDACTAQAVAHYSESVGD